MNPIMGVNRWKDNASLIQAVAQLGYLNEDWLTLDATYGIGGWWSKFRPARLITSDALPTDEGLSLRADFHKLPFPNDTFQAVAFDPPYMLNGQASQGYERYGITGRVDWNDRLESMWIGLTQCARVLAPKGYLLAKCQDQVCSGKVRWQTDMLTEVGRACRLEKVDRLDMLSYRRQPPGRSQVHARRNASTLLVFRKTK